MPGFGFSRGFGARGRRRPSGGTPTPTPTAATLIYDATAKQFVVTNAASFPGAVWAWKDETGTVVAGQTGSTLAYALAPAGLEMQAIPDGVTASASNFALAPVDLFLRTFAFVAEDGTTAIGYDSWEQRFTSNNTVSANDLYRINGNKLTQIADLAGGTSTLFRSTGEALPLRVDFNGVLNPDGADINAKHWRQLYIDWTDQNNYIFITSQNNGYLIYRRGTGDTGAVELVNQSAIYNNNRNLSFARISGRIRAYIDGQETAPSKAAGGWDVSNVPTGGKIGIRGLGKTPWYASPQPILDNIVISATMPVQFGLASATFASGAMTASGTCTASVTNYDWALIDEDGKVWLDWTSNVAVSGAGTWGISGAAIPVGLEGLRVYLALRPSSNKANLLLLDCGVAPITLSTGDATLGLNEAIVAVWNSADPFPDLASRLEWRAPNYDYIVARSVVPSGTDIPMSADGEGGSVKGDLDGTIYPYNTVGLAQYMLIPPAYYSEPGDYIVTLAPGLAVTNNPVPSVPWSYNTTSGELTYTVPSDGFVASLAWLITTASMPSTGLNPTIRKSGVILGPNVLRPVPAASIPQIASVVRIMSAAGVNNWRNNEGGRTDTALPVDTPANTYTGPMTKTGTTIKQQLAYDAAGVGTWMPTKHTAGDALISQQASLLASSAMGLVLSELSNEVWNSGFKPQFHEVRIAGVRRGYAVNGLTKHADAVPETIIDGRPYVNRDTRLVSGRSFAAGDKIYIDWNAVGYQVYTATTTINPGDTVAVGANVSLLYDGTQVGRAGLFWYGRRSKEMWAIQDAAFTAAGKPRPLHVLAWQAAMGFAAIQPALDFDDNYLAVDRISLAFYYGGGVAGHDNGPYTSTSGSWTEAQRDKWYAGDSAGFIADAITAIKFGIDATFAQVLTASNAIAAYSLAKRGDKLAIRLNFYEISHHIQFSGWPDMAVAWAAGTNYSSKQFVWSNSASGGDGKTYRCKLRDRGSWATGVAYSVADYFVSAGTTYYVTTAHTSSTAPPNANVTTTNPTSVQPLSNTAYWGVFVDGNGTTWDATKSALHRNSAPRGYQAAWNALSRSQTFAEQCQGYCFGRLINESGAKEIMFFDRMGVEQKGADASLNQRGAINGWALQYRETDTDVSGGAGTNWQFKVLTELKAAMEAGA